MAVAHAYRPDTFVVDPEQLEEHAEMQVKIIGRDGLAAFHRYFAQTGGLLTACDEPQRVDPAWIIETRVEKYEGDMCRGGCFSKSELAEADRVNAEKQRGRTR